jgi:hypothetical protein
MSTTHNTEEHLRVFDDISTSFALIDSLPDYSERRALVIHDCAEEFMELERLTHLLNATTESKKKEQLIQAILIPARKIRITLKLFDAHDAKSVILGVIYCSRSR